MKFSPAHRRRGAAILHLLFSILIPFLAASAHAHIGSPNIFYEGTVAGHPVRVIIKPPGVIPGLADISVRVEGTGVQHVTVLPVFGETGKQGSPSPDEAPLVRGETNLYTASLWLMNRGAYSVHVGIESTQGHGELVVPVNSLATVRGEMPMWMGAILAFLGVLLFVSFASIIGAAATEATQPPDALPSSRQRWLRSAWSVGAGSFALLAVAGGRSWWQAEDREYSERRLSRAWPARAEVQNEDGRPVLHFKFDVPDGQHREWSPLILDHGKWNHWFLIRQPAQDVFVHLHPYKLGDRKFAAVLPPLPEGDYVLYADLTHESGLYRTLTTTVTLPPTPEDWARRWTRRAANPNDPFCGVALATAATESRRDLDPDDAWHIEAAPPAPSADEALVMNGFKMIWDRPPQLAANREASLRFRFVDANGNPAPLEPYVGMAGHLVLRRSDGSVFVHTHPIGNISMASQAILAARAERPNANQSELFASATNYARMETNLTYEVSFPYAFPREGEYRLWLQFKHKGQVLTATYATEVVKLQ
ncbi:MAG: hypothetical protein AB1705_21335 [Verrucomicrobiota bacterium]